MRAQLRRAHLVRLKLSTVVKSGGGHVAPSAGGAAKRKHHAVATHSAAKAARAMRPAWKGRGGAVCAVPNALSLFLSASRLARHLSSASLSPLSSDMARSGLLLAAVVLVAAAVFDQLPLASAAACEPRSCRISTHANRRRRRTV